MEEIQGRITSKSLQEGVTNEKKWNRYLFVIDNIKYSTFDKAIGEAFNPGNLVNAEFEKSTDGRFNNIKTMILLDKGTEVKTADKIETEKVVETKENKEDKLFVRANALTQANSLLASLINLDLENAKKLFSENKPVDLLINFAKIIEEYLNK